MFYSYNRLYTTTQYTRGRAVTKKTGPNDTSGVIWTKSKSFLVHLSFILRNTQVAGDEHHNKQKWAKWGIIGGGGRTGEKWWPRINRGLETHLRLESQLYLQWLQCIFFGSNQCFFTYTCGVISDQFRCNFRLKSLSPVTIEHCNPKKQPFGVVNL